jgi:glyoxylase-like metal-dependent hydrolase (beta-lactamase superfamily II)
MIGLDRVGPQVDRELRFDAQQVAPAHGPVVGEFAARHFARHGLTDADSIERISNRKDYYSTLVPGVPSQYRRLMDGNVITIGKHQWRIITGFGHAPEHVALYSEDANVLISGDMVLPRISTNVSVFDLEPEADPLTLYLDSLGKYEPLPQDVLILPSHGRPFRGLHTRIRQLREHHVERLAETTAACKQAPQSARDIVNVIFKLQFDVHQMTFAMGEALAHLHALGDAMDQQAIGPIKLDQGDRLGLLQPLSV